MSFTFNESFHKTWRLMSFLRLSGYHLCLRKYLYNVFIHLCPKNYLKFCSLIIVAIADGRQFISESKHISTRLLLLFPKNKAIFRIDKSSAVENNVHKIVSGCLLGRGVTGWFKWLAKNRRVRGTH